MGNSKHPGKGHPTPKAPQNQSALAVPMTQIKAFTGEVEMVLHKTDETGDLPLFRFIFGIAGGVIAVDFPAGFVPQVMNGMAAAFNEWAKTPEGAAALAKHDAKAAGLVVPELALPHGVDATRAADDLAIAVTDEPTIAEQVGKMTDEELRLLERNLAGAEVTQQAIDNVKRGADA